MKPKQLPKVILASILLITTIHAKSQTLKRYNIKSGVIKYNITANGMMMGIETKIRGEKSLYFDNYGSQSLEEIRQIIIQQDSILQKRKTHSLKKIDNATIYSVDFKQKKIIKTTDTISKKYLDLGENLNNNSYEHLIELGGKKIGIDKVLGYKCEIWNIMGTSQCLYQNQIPLWIEADIMGVIHKSIATKIEFDINISSDKLQLPKYPIETLSD